MDVVPPRSRVRLRTLFQSATGSRSQGTAAERIPERRWRRVGRRWLIAVVLAAQLIAIVAAYDNNHRQFGFQMFPESSRWRAEIVRVQPDGTRLALEAGWEYRWSDLVRGRGLTDPQRWNHADSGLRGQLDFFDSSLTWVAENTPEDTTTLYLEAEVTYLDNGRGPETVTYRSPDRDVGGGS